MMGSMDFIIPACVMIIEKHPLMREALATAISDEPNLIAGMKVATGMDAVKMLRIILPDMVLFAVGDPGAEELEALKILRQSLPEVPILALTSNEIPGQEQAILQVGAHAVLTKAATRLDLIDKLHEMMNDRNLFEREKNLFMAASSTSHNRQASLLTCTTSQKGK
jgi:DNA-binding NarL/FixJ family response regulator